MIETPDSPYIHAANSENAQSLVFDNSRAGPVLVNFWSRKAGPCLRQYPILEKLVHHYQGRLLLVNIDVDSEIALSKQFSIASVPTLKLVRNQQVTETLHGFQSEQDLVKMCDRFVARDSDQELSQAIQRYAKGECSEAFDMIANAIVSDPVNPRLPLAMCKLLKHEQRYQEAVRLIDTLPENIRKDIEIDRFYDLLHFYLELDSTQDIESLNARLASNPKDIQAIHQLVTHLLVEQQYESALHQLETIIKLDKHYGENYAQKAMLRIFNILGDDHQLTKRFRPQLKVYTH